jgi:hypothetical protein
MCIAELFEIRIAASTNDLCGMNLVLVAELQVSWRSSVMQFALFS